MGDCHGYVSACACVIELNYAYMNMMQLVFCVYHVMKVLQWYYNGKLY